jgi:hypothetical protein
MRLTNCSTQLRKRSPATVATATRTGRLSRYAGRANNLVTGGRFSSFDSIEALQRRDAVVLLEEGRFLFDLRGVELDLFWIFFGLNFDETTFDWLFDRLGEIA